MYMCVCVLACQRANPTGPCSLRQTPLHPLLFCDSKVAILVSVYAVEASSKTHTPSLPMMNQQELVKSEFHNGDQSKVVK